MDEYETIYEYDRDGWHIAVAIAPDYDYRPGEDDDIFPRFEEVGRYESTDELERPRDYDGRYLPASIVVDSRSGPVKVTPAEIARLIEAGGGNPRRMRKQIASDAAAIAGEHLSWCVVRVTATRDKLTGSDVIGGVEYDLRLRDPDRYALEVGREIADEAIADALAKVPIIAPLALRGAR